jgi:hypothetical protein
MIPRYLYPIEEELLPIPYYFNKLELGIKEGIKEGTEEKQKGGRIRRRSKKRKNKLRRKINTHRKRIR